MAMQGTITQRGLAEHLSPDTPRDLCSGKVPPLPWNPLCFCLWPLGLSPNSMGGCGWDQRLALSMRLGLGEPHPHMHPILQPHSTTCVPSPLYTGLPAPARKALPLSVCPPGPASPAPARQSE